ncbi:MAG: serine/threonine protein kinase [Pseudomonadota bacterium]|nr:MAG: serine/threonine protein kinase [Pseudomonadota bacterium]
MGFKAEYALRPGTLMHQYRIERTLGGGGFSIVYLATDTQRNAQVVVKEYLPSNQATRLEDETVESVSEEASTTFRQGMKRFFEEAAVLAKINHPNIVRVTDFFRENNTVYLVMQYEEGKDLRWYIKRQGGHLSERFIRAVFSDLLLGLRELHNLNLLHLDIKPANILLRPGGKPLLLDFGAAQSAYSGRRLTGPHTLTLGFAPLEQHKRGHIGPWTDLYAIGATMYACLSGKAPPPATKRAERDAYKSAAKKFARSYTRELLEAIDWCLQMDQFGRPQKVDDLLAALQKPPAQPIEDQPDSLFERLSLRILGVRK